MNSFFIALRNKCKAVKCCDQGCDGTYLEVLISRNSI